VLEYDIEKTIRPMMITLEETIDELERQNAVS
jgi:hypothetical protein